ncbi:CARDB domain-containing protein [uncultured Roseovarius sp.]|uniref:CARDB domain-containing protein n=1 Tax=uncultured Roseovarius sp. TaxID=293344 RepID=UPI0026362D70|nr:CARDB domain-containing protein [uncultured Roseovarius sp.]
MTRKFSIFKYIFHTVTAFLLLISGTTFSHAASVDCQADRSGDGLVLYLYFPTSQDSDFPTPIFGEVTNPLEPFDAADLDPALGTTAEYRDAITERVKTDFCEFDVQVVQTTSANGTTNPTPTDDSWFVVGIGSDTGTGFYGVCCNSGMARVWAGEFEDNSQPGGSFDGLLTPGDGTLNRWANAIAGTTSHEPGHSSRLGNPGHDSADPRPTEDARPNHIMDTPSGADRIEDRHFSDTSYEAIAGAVGLYEQTLSNWDFINPNDSAADGLRITVLVDDDDTPEIGSVYDGGLSPWGDADIAANGSLTFQGTSYDRYQITFTDPQNWNNGGSGEIPEGAEFHVGVGLTTNYIVNDVTLLSGGSAMNLHPRVVGYTPDGSFNPETGDYHLTLSVPDPENGPLIVSDVRIRHLPRTLAINEMIASGAMIGVDGRSIVPWQDRQGGDVEVGSAEELPVANLAEPRALDTFRQADPECGSLPQPPQEPDHSFLELPYCEEGPVLGLFPSARVYVEATITDPNARYFDRDTGTMVTGPLSNRIFIQFTGKVPDLNGNGVDDAIDIDTGICSDDNANGVCDSAEPTRYKYAAKLICGYQPVPSDGRLVKGEYATTINVLNLGDQKVKLTKTLSLTYPPKEQRPGKVAEIATDILGPDEALKVDCADVERRVFPNGLPASYIEGYVTIESASRLDVTGVYTSRDTEKAPPCGHSGGGCGEHSCDKHRKCCKTGGGCPGAPALSTTLEIEQIREHVIKPKEPPVEMCPDLRVRDIGGPQVSCPSGSGSCVTTTDYTIENIGNAASGPFSARAILDPNQSVSVPAMLQSLLPGQSVTVPVTTPRGGNCFDPDCTISVAADNTDQVEECNERNNIAQETTPG